jgi:hypothetical protein
VRILAPLVLVLVACSHPEVRRTQEAPAGSFGARSAPQDDPKGARGIVLLELFTSEGCSSCPPADDVLAALSDDHVLGLAYHVDYWDGGGWQDPFSQHPFTVRQSAYAQALGTPLFTPEMVVGGADAFNGSDEAHARSAVAGELGEVPEAPLSIQVRAGGDALRVEWTLGGGGAPRDALLDVAVVEKSRTVRVDAGENRGKTLRHVNVVRSLDSAPLARGESSGARTVRMPAGLSHGGAAVVAWLQSASSLRVLGAARADVP